MPGSAGATGPAHVFKGQRMPGRMGADRITVRNLEIIKVDEANNVLLIKGALPGAKNGLILISAVGQLKIKEEKAKVEEVKEEKIEAVKEDTVEVPVEQEVKKESAEKKEEESKEGEKEGNKNEVEEKSLTKEEKSEK
jgi:large subunit ribosomal protein L3